MKKLAWSLGLLFVLVMSAGSLHGQCYNCDVQFPAGTFSTISNGLTQVTSCAGAGEYSVYNVTAGETYTWTTCGGGAWDTQLTLFTGNTCGTGFLAYNDDDCGLLSTITWTATFTGQVNLLITQWNCQWNMSCMAINWACISCGGGGANYNNPGGTITTCSGNFYDTGGPTGNYANNQNIVTTFCPDEAGSCISLNFTQFATENCCDNLRIYDGPNTGAPLLGQFQGANSPGLIAATVANASGCVTFQFSSDGSVTAAGWAALISCGDCAPDPNAPIETCSATFYDTGGPGGNYSNNESYSVTYCPDTPDQCIQAVFTSFLTENCCDYLRIYDGASTLSPLFGQYQGGNSPGTIGGSVNNTSGCLTFVFYSDGSITSSGWAANIICGECGITPPPPPAPAQDCNGGITICSDATFDGNSSGHNIQELNSTNSGCLSVEHESNWYFFSPQSTGTIAFMINPTPMVDYDFAIWGPFDAPICPPPGPPIRCSWSAALVPTGLQAGAGDNTEGAGGDGVVNPITVGPAEVGQVYILLIDNFSSTTTPFDFNWNLSGGLTLDCTPLPVELLELTGTREGQHNVLRWKTGSENNSDYYAVERSTNGYDYQPIGTVPAAGFSSSALSYVYRDENHGDLRNYYRLKQVDFDGQFEYLGPVAIDGLFAASQFGNPYPNPSETGEYLIAVNFAYNLNLQYIVLDATGRPVLQKSFAVSKGHQTLQIEGARLASGVYQLRFSDDLGQVLHTTSLMR